MRGHLRLALCLLLGAVAGCDGAAGPDPAVSAAAETVPATITLEGTTIRATRPFKVKVTDAGANIDPSSLDAVHVYAKRDPLSNEYERASLVETEVDSGVFEGEFVVALGSTVDGNGILEVNDDDTVYVSYRDQNAGSCLPGIFEAQATVDDSRMPDLSFDSVVADTTIVPGTEYRVTVTLRNDLGGAPAGPSNVHARLTRPSWDSEGYEITEVVTIDTERTGTLLPDERVVLALAGTIPLNTSPRAPFTLEVYADHAREVAEFRENNNSYVVTPAMLGPDLVAEIDSLDPAVVVTAGQPFRVTGTVRNVGGAKAVASTVSVRIHRPSWDHEGYDIDESHQIGIAGVGELGKGEAQEFTVAGTIPEGLNGTYTVEVFADHGYRVAESVENNNGTPAAQEPPIVVKGSDLTVDPALVTSASVLGGDVLRVSGRIRNAEGAARAGASTVQVRIYRPAWDYEGYEIVEEYVFEPSHIPTLLGGESAEFAVARTLPQNLSGPFTLEVTADGGRKVSEYHETNNVAVRTVQVTGADLTVAPVSVPTEVVAGGVYQLQVIVQNAPLRAVADPSVVRGWLWREAEDSEGYPYDEVYELLASSAVPSLSSPGASSEITLSGSIPPQVTPGTFKLTLRADALFSIEEYDEGNNAWPPQGSVEYVTVRAP